jgi:hypothetical protein
MKIKDSLVKSLLREKEYIESQIEVLTKTLNNVVKDLNKNAPNEDSCYTLNPGTYLSAWTNSDGITVIEPVTFSKPIDTTLNGLFIRNDQILVSLNVSDDEGNYHSVNTSPENIEGMVQSFGWIDDGGSEPDEEPGLEQDAD